MVGGYLLAVVAIVLSNNNLAAGMFLKVIVKIQMGDASEEEDVWSDVTFLTRTGEMVWEDVDVNSEVHFVICVMNKDLDLVADVILVFNVGDVT